MASSKPSEENDDFYNADAIFNIVPEETIDVDQEDPSEDGVDEDFLKELGCAKQTPFKRSLKYFIFLLKGEAKSGVRIINLPHPKTHSMNKYILNSEGKLLEIQKTGDLSSWFLNDKCIEDGSVFLTSEMDPLYIMLPIMDKARKSKMGNAGVFVQSATIFEEVDRLAAKLLRPFVALLHLICDVKTQLGETFYRLNDEKVTIWLRHKLDRLCARLEQMPDVGSLVRAQVSTFRAKAQPITKMELMKLGLGFLGEYVQKKWIHAVEVSSGLAAAEAAASAARAKAYASEEDVAPRKRAHPSNGFDEDLTKEVATTPKKKVNLAQARLAKVDKRGMSPITSFFKKAGS